MDVRGLAKVIRCPGCLNALGKKMILLTSGEVSAQLAGIEN